MITDGNKDDYIPPQQHGYTNVIATEPYYYATNYMNMQYTAQAPVNDATGSWQSTAATTADSITFISPFGEYEQYGYGFQPAYNFGFTGTGEYASWTGIPTTTSMNPKALYDEYYPQINNTTVINPQDSHIANEHLNKLENGISNMNLGTNMTQSNNKESQNEVLDNNDKNSKDKNNNNTTTTANTATNNINNTTNSVTTLANTNTTDTITNTVATTTCSNSSTTTVVQANNNTIGTNINNSNTNNNPNSASGVSTNTTANNAGVTYNKPVFGQHKNKLNNNNGNNNVSTNISNSSKINNDNNNNNKSWASVVSSQSYTATTPTNKKLYTSHNHSLLQNNSTNVITTYAVSNSAIISPNRQQNVDLQFVNNPKQQFNNNYNTNNQILSTNYNYQPYYRHNYYYNQQNSYYNQGGGHYPTRNRGHSFNQNSNFYTNSKRNYNTGIYTTLSTVTTTASSNVATTTTPTTTTTTTTTNSNSNNNIPTNNSTSTVTNTSTNTTTDSNLDNGKSSDQNTTTVSNNSENSSSSSCSSSSGSNNSSMNNNNSNITNTNAQMKNLSDENATLAKLKLQNQYNPKEFNLLPRAARYFVIKSYSEDDVHRSIKYNIWCSTEHGNRRLDQAFREREGKGPVYLFFSVNGSGHFCGMAEMMSCVDYDSKSNVWSQDKWKGKFEVKWIYVKDVPNSQLRNIRLENNENKPVTNSRDTQEIPSEKGKQVLKVFHIYRNTTSIFDDFEHYEKRQVEDHKKPVLSIL